MKLGDVFKGLGDIPLVKLVRWYGLCILGVVGFIVAGAFAYIVFLVVLSVAAMLPWWGWLLVAVVVSGFLAVHFTEPDRGIDEDMRILHTQLYRHDEE